MPRNQCYQCGHFGGSPGEMGICGADSENPYAGGMRSGSAPACRYSTAHGELAVSRD